MKKKRRFRKTRWVLGILVVGSVFFGAVYSDSLINAMGGAFTKPPEAIAKASPEAKALIDAAFKGLDSKRMLDFHVHVVGLGIGNTGAFVNPKMRSYWHPLHRFKFSIYASASGIKKMKRADAEYVGRLFKLIKYTPGQGRYGLLAFDKHYRADGTVSLEETEFHTPNDYVISVAEKHADRAVPVGSIHPYRQDAVKELERVHKKGVRLIKWLPNAMGIDPADARCDPFYKKMAQLNMVLLSHAGEEQAVEADEAQKLGNPLRLRRALDAGVKVIVAHCASLGQGQDLDAADKPLVDNFDLFLRLMDDKRYVGKVFGEISAVLQFNRLPGPLTKLLERTDLHGRLVNGSDYPLPAINALVRTENLLDLGMITEKQYQTLNQIYDFNPLLFDFVLKRTLRHPKTGAQFAPSVFMVPAPLAHILKPGAPATSQPQATPASQPTPSSSPSVKAPASRPAAN